MKNAGCEPQFEMLNLAAIIIRAKYQLWNQEGRTNDNPHLWLCLFLNEDRRRRVTKGPSNWYKFTRACKKIAGDKKVKITKAEVWRHLTMYFVTTRYWGPISDDESEASSDKSQKKPNTRARKLEF